MKLFRTSMLVLGMALLLGQVRAYAVPTIDGNLGAGEWANIASPSANPYPYYLEVFDPNEADNVIDNMDISHGVVLQELTSVSGYANFANDGIYILLEVYAPPPSLAFATGPGVVPTGQPIIKMEGDLLGDGLNDPFNLFLRHYNTQPA